MALGDSSDVRKRNSPAFNTSTARLFSSSPLQLRAATPIAPIAFAGRNSLEMQNSSLRRRMLRVSSVTLAVLEFFLGSACPKGCLFLGSRGVCNITLRLIRVVIGHQKVAMFPIESLGISLRTFGTVLRC